MLVRAIGLGRVVGGLVSLFSPKLATRFFQLPQEQMNPSLSLVSRLVGDRDLALGAMLLCVPESKQPGWLKLSAAIDAADAAASVWGVREGLASRAVLAGAVSAAGYCALELIALRRLTSQDQYSHRTR